MLPDQFIHFTWITHDEYTPLHETPPHHQTSPRPPEKSQKCWKNVFRKSSVEVFSHCLMQKMQVMSLCLWWRWYDYNNNDDDGDGILWGFARAAANAGGDRWFHLLTINVLSAAREKYWNHQNLPQGNNIIRSAKIKIRTTGLLCCWCTKLIYIYYENISMKEYLLLMSKTFTPGVIRLRRYWLPLPVVQRKIFTPS